MTNNSGPPMGISDLLPIKKTNVKVDPLSLDVANMHNSARALLLGYQRCMRVETNSDGKSSWPVFAGLISAVLACEIFLKAVLVSQKISPPNSHNGLLLFRLMPEEWQFRAAYHFARRVGYDIGPAGVELELFKIQEAFIHWRYLYEGIAEPISIDFRIFNCLLEAMDEVAKDARNEWERSTQA